MCNQSRLSRRDQLAALLLLSFPVSVLAANVMNLTGYGTESTFMGGADVAVSRDTFAANNNPAGMSQISGRALDLNASFFHAEGASHSDGFGSYRRDAKNQDGGYGNLGYAMHVPDSPYTVGVAFVVQGGLGWIYKNMNTTFGTRDEATSLFSILKLVPAASWQINDRLSVGGALGVNYIAGSQTLFPHTSALPSVQFPQGFQGINFKDASGIGFSGKLGLQYRPMEDVVFGLTYGTKTRLPLKGGIMRVNYSATGQGMVRYDDAKIEGMALPQEIAIGVSFRPVKSLLISLQDKWYDWGGALQGLTLTAKNPRNPAVPQVITSNSRVDALGQHVYSVGAAYDYDDKMMLMGGINYGRRAIPEQNLSPTFQVIQQMHYMAGVRYKIGSEWMVDAGIERIPQQMVTYNNLATPFGPSVANHSGTVLHMTASRRWD